MTGRERVLGLRALNRALLDRQLLTERSPMSAADAVAHLLAMQAQAERPPHIGLWTRLSQFSPHDLDQLLVDRTVVRLALMRSTLHLVTAEDALALRALLADALRRTAREQFGRQLIGVDLDDLGTQGRPWCSRSP